MTGAGILLWTLPAALVAMTALWLLSHRLSDVSIIDIAWAPAFVGIAILSLLVEQRISLRAELVIALAILWATRLGLHIYRRWKRLGHEDYRYAEIRKQRGPNFALTSLFWIFWLQALLAWVISWPLQFSVIARLPLTAADGMGLGLTAFGILFEAIADQQLTAFHAGPESHGKVLNTGLWSVSRHPNYFGDCMIWWGFFVVAIASGAPYWTILSPVVMSALLVHYSGGGLMEDTIATRRPNYQEYIRRTSFFVPWWPRA